MSRRKEGNKPIQRSIYVAIRKGTSSLLRNLPKNGFYSKSDHWRSDKNALIAGQSCSTWVLHTEQCTGWTGSRIFGGNEARPAVPEPAVSPPGERELVSTLHPCTSTLPRTHLLFKTQEISLINTMSNGTSGPHQKTLANEKSGICQRMCKLPRIWENVPKSKLALHPSSFGKEGLTVVNVGASVSTKSVLGYINMTPKCFHCIIGCCFFISLTQILANEVEETIRIMFFIFYKIAV